MSSRISPDLVWPGHKKIPFPFWSFILSFFIFNLSTVEFFNLVSTVQVWRSFFLPSWPATYVCPPAIFICSWSNEWCSLSFTLMSARLSFLKDTEMRQTKKTKKRTHQLHSSGGSWHAQNQFPCTVDARHCERAVYVWEILLYFYCSSPVMRLTVRARVAAWIASVG